MKYINWNGEKISKLSLGTVQFGLDYGVSNENGKPTQENVNKIISFIKDNGINCFDTAQGYGNSEKVLGISLEKYQDNMVISKVTSNNLRNNFISSIKKSLENLQEEKLFAVLLHDSEILFNWTQTDSEIVTNAISNNLIKYFGVSIYTDEEFQQAIENPIIQIIQIPFNLLDQRAITKEWFKKAKENNKLLFIRSVYLQGLILMDINKVPKHLDKAKPYLLKLENIAKQLNISKNSLALSFVNQIAKDSVILFGCETLEQAEENINTYNENVLSNQEIELIENLFVNVDEYIYNPTNWK